MESQLFCSRENILVISKLSPFAKFLLLLTDHNLENALLHFLRKFEMNAVDSHFHDKCQKV
jgi:hypothetical protein